MTANPNQWLDTEMDRIWLLAELCLRQMQQAKLRPEQAPHQADAEAIFASRRATRTEQADAIADMNELHQALDRTTARLTALRGDAPFGRLARGLGLRPLEQEALMVILTPHIDQPLGQVFALIRGVDLGLVGLLYRLTRSQRVHLLDVVDPERPLLSWRLLQVGSPETAESYASVSSRPLQPTLDLLSVVGGRGQIAPALRRAAQFEAGLATLADRVLEEQAGALLGQLCADAATLKEQPLAEVPWLQLCGPEGIGKREIASRCTLRGRISSRPLGVDELRLFGQVRRRRGCGATARHRPPGLTGRWAA